MSDICRDFYNLSKKYSDKVPRSENEMMDEMDDGNTTISEDAIDESIYFTFVS